MDSEDEAYILLLLSDGNLPTGNYHISLYLLRILLTSEQDHL
jgi:hypothetical protein